MSDFSVIEAVAASSWYVYAATTHGLLIYDRVSRRFRTPVTAIDGYPAQRVRRAIADPTANAVWLDLGAGVGYLRYDVDGRAWTPGTPTSTTGTLTVEAALASAPLADAMRAAILTDQRLRTHQFTAAAATPDRPEIFFGTNGVGLVRVDKQTGEWEVLSYGLLAPAVGAVTRGPGGVWAATSALAGGRAQRRGLSWVASDLSATRTSEGGRAALGFSFLHARRLLADGDYLWIASEQGVLRVDSTGFTGRQWDLPEAICLARSPRGIWAGTARGLSLITADEQVLDIAPAGIAITSLLATGDTLWVGTTAGLARVVPGGTELTIPLELRESASMRVTVHALARLQDTIVMATERELFWRDPATQAWTPVPLPPALGIPTALAATPQGALWIGGTRGIAQADVRSGHVRTYTVPFEIPAPVRDLAADRDYLWAATDSGLVRIQ
jgi:ligand-binding sensor domain-containing protein